eukprot:gene7497-biopygen3366
MEYKTVRIIFGSVLLCLPPLNQQQYLQAKLKLIANRCVSIGSQWCCSQCEATPDCGSFAFALGKCFLKNCRDTDHSQQFSEDLAKARSRSGDVAVQALVLTGRRKVAKA